ncbi:MAG: TonB-dependent receptor [Bacteroidetes bacterium]|nr:TonB-dependent receptor [Bacteroidota bacterium]
MSPITIIIFFRRSLNLKRFIILLLFCFFIFSGKAQPKNEGAGKISGKIVDSLSGQQVDYATISLINEETGKVVNGTTTDDKGIFELTGIENGDYKMLIYFIGYHTKTIPHIVISKANTNVQLGSLQLAGSQTVLKEVTVATEKSIIENKIDKTVYNVEQDITSQSGVAADVLKKIPQVSVDVDGNVELQGNASIRFLINGKPSIIFGNNIAEVLQSIPSNQIKSIEVITSPGAKYDAEGTGGIINIILKKSTAEGINGNVSLSVGTRLENGSLNLNAHHKHFGINAFVSGNGQLPSTTVNTSRRISKSDSLGQSLEFLQNGTSEFSRKGFESGLGFDWELSAKNNLTGSLGFDYFENSNVGINNRRSVLSDAGGIDLSDVSDKVNTTSHSNSQSLDWQLIYKRTFAKEDRELEISCEASNGTNYSYYKQLQSPANSDALLSASYGKNPGTENETDVAVDYVEPLGKGAMLEAGAKTVFGRIISNSSVYDLDGNPGDYIYNATQSSALTYKSNVYAGYASVTFKLLKWLDVKTGFRYEYTKPHAVFSGAGSVLIKPYGTYVPSGVISHTFEKNRILKLSYTHRIERPEYRDLNPFINASDPKNLSTGNTSLRPEVGDKIELSFSKTYEKGTTINATLFYRGNKDDIQSFTRFYSSYAVGDTVYSNVSVTTRENIGRENNFGINIFASVPFTSKINFRTNIACFQRYIINGALPGNNVQGFNYRINANGSYQVTETFGIELFGNFNSPRVNAQGKMPAFTTYNFAVRKQFLKKQMSLAITATNIFSKYVSQKTELTGTDFTMYNVRELPYRSFGINFTYKFGKLEFKKEREPEDVNLTNPPGN